jgi:hypothetical protein
MRVLARDEPSVLFEEVLKRLREPVLAQQRPKGSHQRGVHGRIVPGVPNCVQDVVAAAACRERCSA